MEVQVDGDRCMGHAMCQAFAAEVYRVDAATGMNEMGEFTVPAPLDDAAVRGAEACPERAISVR